MLLQKTMVSGLEIVSMKQLVKLLKGVQTETTWAVSLMPAIPLCRIIRPNKTSMTEPVIPNFFLIPFFWSSFPIPINDKFI